MLDCFRQTCKEGWIVSDLLGENKSIVLILASGLISHVTFPAPASLPGIAI